jgi:glycosyltransferase involved in cell wall biosynthesis
MKLGKALLPRHQSYQGWIMRFLFTLAYPDWTGPAEPMAQLALALVGRGHEVSVWSDGKRSGNLHEKLCAMGIESQQPLYLSRKSGPIAIARDIARAGELLRGNFDRVVCHMSADQMIVGQSKRSHKVPVMRYIQNLGSSTTRPGRGLLLRSADALLVPSKDHAARARDLASFASERVGVLRGAVDLERFQPGNDVALRERMRLKDDDILLISVSRQKPERRQMDLLQAFAQASKGRDELHLAFIGRGEYQSELSAESSRLGLDSRVLFAGYAQGDDLQAAFQACDASVWLAEGNDGTCRAVGQSLACGKPVIGAKLGAIRDALEPHAQAGWLVPQRQIGALSETLLQLPTRTQLMESASACRAIAEAEWDPTKRCDQFLQLSERLCAP